MMMPSATSGIYLLYSARRRALLGSCAPPSKEGKLPLASLTQWIALLASMGDGGDGKVCKARRRGLAKALCTYCCSRVLAS